LAVWAPGRQPDESFCFLAEDLPVLPRGKKEGDISAEAAGCWRFHGTVAKPDQRGLGGRYAYGGAAELSGFEVTTKGEAGRVRPVYC